MNETTPITNFDDVIDSRDVIARIEYLMDQVMDPEMNDYLADADPADVSEFAQLREIHNEAKDDVEDWEHGATLIRDSYFRDYAMELADDIGAVPADVSWPLTCIDWEQAARELRMDYTSIEFGDVTYWVR